MSDIKTHNAKDILTEALDTIKATYWIMGKEFTMAQFTDWENVTKSIEAELDDNCWSSYNRKEFVAEDSKRAKIIGVCSVGAIALANVTLYDEELLPFGQIATRDPETLKAGAALAREILIRDINLPGEDEEGYNVDEPPYFWLEESGGVGDIIAGWNDRYYRTREDVIEMFTKAQGSTLLTAQTLYRLVFTDDSGYKSTVSVLYFASEQEAQELIDGDSKLRNALIQNYSSLGNSEVKIEAITFEQAYV